LVSSKARRITLLQIGTEGLSEVRSRALFPEDPSESELTHVDVSADGSWAVATRTLIEKNAAGETTACGGELVFIDISDDAQFGALLAQIPVGPMPDAVAISPDGKTVLSANERDVVWGKCEQVAAIDPPSISIVDVSEGPAQAKELKRVLMTGEDKREPEYVAFSAKGDLFAVTLQDSNEVALFRLSALLPLEAPTDANAEVIVKLPQNSIGQDAWPDGVALVVDGEGKEHFVIAGEGNDMFYLLDGSGAITSAVEINASDIPAAYPRDGSWGPLFRPDSVTAMRWEEQSYVAFSLKASGAVGIWNVTVPQSVTFVQTIKVGADEQATTETESSVGTEGIAASSDFGFIVTANEAESSVSLVLPTVTR
ncbi:MAG: hypothetical protein JRH20_22195, partial [Deltaproteobacteria bacterium]|nr:hypothetical protein [Deltaproteobacteria bacterium]